VLIVLAAVWVVSPVLSSPTRLIPIRHNTIQTVPVFNAWTIWWNADRLTHGFADYWNAPIFWPHQSTFAWSEPQPATIVVAPVLWLTGSPTAAYNVWMLLTLVANGLVGFLVVRRQGGHRHVAAIIGLLMVWLPINIRQLEVVQLVAVWPLFWTWDAARRLFRTGRLTHGIETALAVTIGFYCSVHHTLFQAVLLLFAGWPLVYGRLRQLNVLRSLLVSLLISGALIAVVAVPMHRALDRDEFERRKDLVTQLSVRPADLIRPPKDAFLFPTERRATGRSPGWVKLTLGTAGIVLGLLRIRRRRWTMFLAWTTVCAALLAMGPHLKFDGIVPWWFLWDWVPGLKLVRSVFRFTYFLQLAVVLLTAVGLHEIYVRVRASGRANVALGIVWLAGLAAIAELPVPRPMVAGLPDLKRHTQWTDFVRNNVGPDEGIVCLPFAASPRARDFGVTVRWMYYGTQHGKPMVNGYSGFFPDDYLELRREIRETGLSAKILQQFYDDRIRYLVIRRDVKVPAHLLQESAAVQLVPAWQDPVVRIDVYRLENSDAARPFE
jgi:hypothetical protein